MKNLKNAVVLGMERVAGRMSEQLFVHFATFVIFLLIGTFGLGWFLFRGPFQPVSFFYRQTGSFPVPGFAWPDGTVADWDELLVISLKTRGDIRNNPKAQEAFFDVMDVGEGLTEFNRFLSPFRDPVSQDVLAPGNLDRLSPLLLDEEGSRLKGYFQISRGASPREVRRFVRWARGRLSGDGEVVIAVPPLVRYLYREQLFMTGGFLMAVGILLTFLVLLWVTRRLPFALPAAFLVPIGTVWGGGILSKLGFPLSTEMLVSIPVLFLIALPAALRFWALFSAKRRSGMTVSGPRERFRREAGPALSELFRSWIGVVPAAAAVLLWGQPIFPAALFFLLTLVCTAFVSLIILPLAASRVEGELTGPHLAVSLYPQALFTAPAALLPGVAVLVLALTGIRLFPLGVTEISDLLSWFTSSGIIPESAAGFSLIPIIAAAGTGLFLSFLTSIFLNLKEVNPL